MKIFFASCNHFLISSSYIKSTKMMQQLIKMLFDLTKNDSVIHFHLDIVVIRLVSSLLIYIFPLWVSCDLLLLNFCFCKEYGFINDFSLRMKDKKLFASLCFSKYEKDDVIFYWQDYVSCRIKYFSP